MPLVTTKNEHVTFVKQVMLAASYQFDLTSLARKVFACAALVRDAGHSTAGSNFGARNFQPGNCFGHQRPDYGALTFLFRHFFGRYELELAAWRPDEFFYRDIEGGGRFAEHGQGWVCHTGLEAGPGGPGDAGHVRQALL